MATDSNETNTAPSAPEKPATVDLTRVEEWPSIEYDPNNDARTYHAFTVNLPGGLSYRLTDSQFRSLAEDAAYQLKWLNEEAS